MYGKPNVLALAALVYSNIAKFTVPIRNDEAASKMLLTAKVENMTVPFCSMSNSVFSC